MKNGLSVLILGILLVASSVHANRIEVIYRGNPISMSDESWNYVVRFTSFTEVESKDGRKKVRAQICTGTFITSSMILTAAHCLMKDKGTVLNVQFFKGADVVKDEYYRRDTYKIFLRPTYTSDRSDSVDSDLAIIKFNDAILKPNQLTAQLFDENMTALKAGMPVAMVGAGTHISGKLSKHLELAIGSVKQFGDASLWVQGTQGICHGDSGGPLFIKNKAGKPVMVGVLSRFDETKVDPANDNCGPGGGYTLIPSAKNVEWLESVLAPEAKDI